VEGALRGDEELAAWLAGRGVSRERPIVVYDDFDAQKGSMLAWILEYLGHDDVSLLDAPFGRWQATGRELFYRPVRPGPASFAPSPRPELRATRQQVADAAGALLDVRSPEEHAGVELTPGEAVGRIPGSVHASWLAFVRDEDTLFAGDEEVTALLAELGLADAESVIVYCRSGPRAAVAATALRLSGRQARLYVGSFLDWTAAQMPVE
jgi:thiosulfate/3-mercaptopyruvate sulfurtransferase